MDSDLELRNLLFNLNKGKTILYPTDTVWGIGCDATDFDAVQKIYKIKKREETKSLIILVDSIEMLNEYVTDIPKKVIILLNQIDKPTTIIYNNPKGLASNTIAIDNTIAIRVVKNKFCQSLIKEFGKPIVSTSANVSGEETPKSFNYISDEIKKNVDYIVRINEESLNNKPSTILKIMEDGVIVTLRE